MLHWLLVEITEFISGSFDFWADNSRTGTVNEFCLDSYRQSCGIIESNS